MQESRLFKIIYHLLDKGHATAPELAEKFEVSKRTIYRDIDALSSAGIPVYVTTGRNGGVHLLDNYVLDKSLFSETEKQEMLSGLQSLSAVQYLDVEIILNKLGAIFKTVLTDWIEVDFSRWGSLAERESALFSQLRKSIFEKLQIRFNYISSTGENDNREAQPLKLIYKDKAWYLYAFCLYRNDFRLFRLSRIKDLRSTNEHFVRVLEKAHSLYPQPEKLGPLVDLKLQFPLNVGYKLYDVLNDTAIKRHETGYHVELTLPENEWLYDFLMSFGNNVTIIQPDPLRKKIIEKYKAALQNYEGEFDYEC